MATDSGMQAKPLLDLRLLVEACERAYAGDEMAVFGDDEDISTPPSGIMFGMIRRARAALEALDG